MEYSTTTEAQSYKDGINGMFKITTIFLTIMIGLILLSVDAAYLMSIKSKFTPDNLTVLGAYNYTPITSSHIGNTFTPLAKLPMIINGQTQEFDFLIDSGAIASTIPQQRASDYDVDVATLPRILIQGVTDLPSYGYVAQGKLKLDKDNTIDLPVIFAPTNQYILGITGLFDAYTLIFDHQSQSVSIAKPK